MKEINKVAFSGPSGSGKTTMVQFVKDKYDLPWVNGSSGQIKEEQDRIDIEAAGLSTGGGHLRVIQTGHMNPQAAILNQNRLLTRRTQFMGDLPNFVTDRSPLDNWVYYQMQCSMYQTEGESLEFMYKCLKAVSLLDAIIFIPALIKMEDNGSRIPNIWFQKAVTGVFRQAIGDFKKIMWSENMRVPIIVTLNQSSIEGRQAEIEEALKTIS